MVRNVCDTRDPIDQLRNEACSSCLFELPSALEFLFEGYEVDGQARVRH